MGLRLGHSDFILLMDPSMLRLFESNETIKITFLLDSSSVLYKTFTLSPRVL